MEHVYHFTDNVRLPWILKSGVLNISASNTGPFPKLDFLWATSMSTRCPTATICNSMHLYKEGKLLLVRFTLDVRQFYPWRTVMARYPIWTPDMIELLAETGKALGDDPDTWYCREAPLPKSDWLALAVRSYTIPWTYISMDHALEPGAQGSLAIPVLGRSVFSKPMKLADGRTSYQVAL